jgi:hypothetical protein
MNTLSQPAFWVSFVCVASFVAIVRVLFSRSAKEWLRTNGVPAPRSRLEAQAVMAEARANLNRHTDKQGREYESDIVQDMMTGEYSSARYYWGGANGFEQWEQPFLGRDPAHVKIEADDMRDRGLVFEYDEDGFRIRRPMTPEQLALRDQQRERERTDPQKYKGCIRLEVLK